MATAVLMRVTKLALWTLRILFLSRHALAFENLALRQQLAVFKDNPALQRHRAPNCSVDRQPTSRDAQLLRGAQLPTPLPAGASVGGLLPRRFRARHAALSTSDHHVRLALSGLLRPSVTPRSRRVIFITLSVFAELNHGHGITG